MPVNTEQKLVAALLRQQELAQKLPAFLLVRRGGRKAEALRQHQRAADLRIADIAEIRAVERHFAVHKVHRLALLTVQHRVRRLLVLPEIGRDIRLQVDFFAVDALGRFEQAQEIGAVEIARVLFPVHQLVSADRDGLVEPPDAVARIVADLVAEAPAARGEGSVDLLPARAFLKPGRGRSDGGVEGIADRQLIQPAAELRRLDHVEAEILPADRLVGLDIGHQVFQQPDLGKRRGVDELAIDAGGKVVHVRPLPRHNVRHQARLGGKAVPVAVDGIVHDLDRQLRVRLVPARSVTAIVTVTGPSPSGAI